MSVSGDERPAAQTLQLRMCHDELYHPFTQAFAAMRFEDEDIREIRIRGTVRDDAGEANLHVLPFREFFEDAETERTLNGPRNNFTRNAAAPVTSGEEAVDDIEIDE